MSTQSMPKLGSAARSLQVEERTSSDTKLPLLSRETNVHYQSSLLKDSEANLTRLICHPSKASLLSLLVCCLLNACLRSLDGLGLTDCHPMLVNFCQLAKSKHRGEGHSFQT